MSITPQPAAHLPAADAWVFMTITACDRTEYLNVIRACTGDDELDEILTPDTQFVFLVCNDESTRLCALRDEAEALQMYLHFVDAYADAKCLFKVILAVQEELELQLRLAGLTRFLQVSQMAGAA
jgi:hypothetical protein